jgi:hypothetical protein
MGIGPRNRRHRDLHSNYGPTADTGRLMQNVLLAAETRGGAKLPLPGTGGSVVSERPYELRRDSPPPA